jgi:hypothetical protein
MPFTTVVGNAILNGYLKGTLIVLPTDWDVSLHTGDPGQDGSNEVAAGAYTYARQEPSIGAVAAKAATNDVALTWTNMPSATVTHAGLWGYFTDTWVFLWGNALAASKVVPAAATFELPIADLDFLLT